MGHANLLSIGSHHSIHSMSDHLLFVSTDDSHGYGTTRRGNNFRIRNIVCVVDFDPKATQTFTYPESDARGVFANAACEYQSLEPAQRSYKSPNPFFGLVAEQFYGFFGSNVVRFS